MKVCLRIIRKDSGFVAVWVAVSSLLIMSMLALVIDLGYSYAFKRRLQTAVDAAALSACDVWIENPTRSDLANTEATAMVLRHSQGLTSAITTANVTVTMPNANPKEVIVRAEYSRPSFFGPLMGGNNLRMGAQARAVQHRLSAVRYAAPWAMTILGRPLGVRYFVRDNAGWVRANGNLVSMSPDGLTWANTFTMPNTPGGYDVNLWVYGEFNSEEYISNPVDGTNLKLARIHVTGPGQPTSVSWSNPLFVETDGQYGPSGTGWPLITATVNGVTTTIDNRPPTYSNQAVVSYPAVVGTATVGYVIARRPSWPVTSVTVDPPLVAPGGTVRLEVKLNNFDPRLQSHTTQSGTNRQFILKQSGGTYTGDYTPLEMSTQGHVLCAVPSFNAVGITNMNLANWNQTGYQGAMHTNDEFRFGPVLAPGISGYQRSPLILPIGIKVGVQYVRLVGFCAFRPTAYLDGGATVRGTFDSYSGNPNQYVAPAPAGATNAIYAARLVR